MKMMRMVDNGDNDNYGKSDNHDIDNDLKYLLQLLLLK